MNIQSYPGEYPGVYRDVCMLVSLLECLEHAEYTSPMKTSQEVLLRQLSGQEITTVL